MADKSFILQILVNATDNASSVLGGIGGAAQGLGVATLGAVGVATGALTTIGVVAVGVGQDFDDALDILSSRTGVAGPQLDEMGRSVKTLEGDFVGLNRSMGDIASIMAEVRSRTGETGGDLEDLTRRILTLSDITGTDAQANVANLTRVFGDWGVSIEDQGAALDTLFAASQQTGIGIDTLGQRIVQFGAPLRQMGFSFDESVAMLGKWEKEGVNTELVLGSLRIAAGKFADSGVDLHDGLMQAFDAIKSAKSESEALTIAMDTFGARAGPDMAAAIREGRFEFDDLVQSLQGSEGALDSAANSTIGFSERWQMALNKMKLALEPLGTKLLDLGLQAMPLVESAVSSLTDILDNTLIPAIDTYLNPALSIAEQFVNDLVSGIQAGQSPIEAFSNALTNALPPEFATTIATIKQNLLDLLTQVQGFAQPVIDWVANNVTLQDGLTALGIAVATVVVPALFGLLETIAPIVLVFAGLTLAVALLRTAWESNFLGIRDAVKVVFDWFEERKPVIEAALQTLGVVVKAVFDAIKTTIVDEVWPKLQEAFTQISEALGKLGIDWDDLGQVVLVVAEVIGVILLALVGVIVGIVEAIAAILKAAAENWNKMAEDIKIILQGFSDFFSGWYDLIAGILTLDFGRALDGFVRIWKGAGELVIGTVRFLFDSVVGLFNLIIAAVDGFTSGVADFFYNLYEELVGHSVIPDLINGINKWFEKLRLDTIANFINAVIKKFESLQGAISKLKLPKWLTPGSPTPFEIGLSGINDEMKRLAGSELPRLNNAFSGIPGQAPALAGVSAAGGSDGGMIHTHIYIDGREVGYAVAPGVKEKFQQDGTIDGKMKGSR